MAERGLLDVLREAGANGKCSKQDPGLQDQGTEDMEVTLRQDQDGPRSQVKWSTERMELESIKNDRPSRSSTLCRSTALRMYHGTCTH